MTTELVFDGAAAHVARISTDTMTKELAAFGKAFAPATVVEMWHVHSHMTGNLTALALIDAPELPPSTYLVMTFGTQTHLTSAVTETGLPFALAIDVFAVGMLECGEAGVTHAGLAVRQLANAIAHGYLSAQPEASDEHACWSTAMFLVSFENSVGINATRLPQPPG